MAFWNATRSLFAVQAASTLAMTGLNWFVQVVHYPLMGRVPAGAFVAYEAEHVRLTGWVVAPLMLAEVLSAVALACAMRGRPRLAQGTGLALLAGLWLSTAFWQVPLHDRLGLGFDAAAHAELVASSWIRTALWTARSLVVLGLLRHVAGRAR